MSKTILAFSLAFVLASLAVGGYFLILEIKGYQVTHSNERMKAAQYEQDNVKGYLQACEGIKPKNITTIFGCITKQQKESRETKTSHYDLKAQQEMAVWAYVIVWFTGAGVIASFAAFIALVIDIRMAGVTGRAQVRAYLIIDEPIFIDQKDQNETISHTNIHLTVSNQGASPARVQCATCRFIENDKAILSDVDIDEMRTEKMFVTIGSNTPQNLTIAKITASNMRASSRNPIKIAYFIEYLDVFDEPQTLIHAFEYRMVKAGRDEKIQYETIPSFSVAT